MFIELIFGKPVNRNVEATIHGVGMMLLMLFSAIIMFFTAPGGHIAKNILHWFCPEYLDVKENYVFELRECERPREKLLVQGASALGNAELLAVLLGSGTPAQSVIDISNALLAKAGWRLDRLFALSVADLESVDGIGPARAATVQAAFELGRRFLVEKADAPRVIVVSGRSVYDLMIPRLKGLDHEECWAVLLDTLGRCNGTVRLTSGGFDSTVLDIRQIVRMAVRKAFRNGAKALCACHGKEGAVSYSCPQPSFRRSEAERGRLRHDRQAPAGTGICLHQAG